MKRLAIVALSLCLTAPMSHANDDEGCYGRFGRAGALEGYGTMIGVGSLAAIYGIYRIHSAINKSREQAPLLAPQASQAQHTKTLEDIRKGLGCVVVGGACATWFWINMTICESIYNNN